MMYVSNKFFSKFSFREKTPIFLPAELFFFLVFFNERKLNKYFSREERLVFLCPYVF